MTTFNFRRGSRALLIAAAGLGCVALGFNQHNEAAVKAFTGARIIDGTGKPAIQKGTVIVRNGKIEAVGASVKTPKGAEVIDVSGKTIMPGMINGHGHVGETRGLKASPENYNRDNIMSQLGVSSRYGVTTVLALGSDLKPAFDLRDEQNTPQLNRARLYVAGNIITGTTPEQTRKMVSEVADTKPDIIKVRVDDNLGTSKKMPAAAYKALIDEAHKKGLRVATHMFYLEDAKDLVSSGADVLAHSVRDLDVDSELIAMMKKHNVYYCPTLMREVSTFVYESTPAFFADPFFLREVGKPIIDELNDPKRQEAMRNSKSAQRYKIALEQAKRNLKKLSDSGVNIVMGTDSGVPARFPGYFEHMELELMTQAGLTPMQTLVSATGDAAKYLKLSGKIGSIQPGAWADLVVLNANPLDDIRNSRKIDSVWIAGNRIQR